MPQTATDCHRLPHTAADGLKCFCIFRLKWSKQYADGLGRDGNLFKQIFYDVNAIEILLTIYKDIYHLDGKITSSKMRKLKSCEAHKLANWQAEQFASCQTDKMRKGHDDRMTRWQEDKMIQWHDYNILYVKKDDRMTGWQDDRMTWWHGGMVTC